jgi:hypothetical protein
MGVSGNGFCRNWSLGVCWCLLVAVGLSVHVASVSATAKLEGSVLHWSSTSAAIRPRQSHSAKAMPLFLGQRHRRNDNDSNCASPHDGDWIVNLDVTTTQETAGSLNVPVVENDNNEEELEMPLLQRQGGDTSSNTVLQLRGGAQNQKQVVNVKATKAVAATKASGGGGSASFMGSVFNLVNNVAGAGILTLAAGKATGTGWIPSILIGASLAAVSAHTFTLIGKACDMSGEKDFAVSVLYVNVYSVMMAFGHSRPIYIPHSRI